VRGGSVAIPQAGAAAVQVELSGSSVEVPTPLVVAGYSMRGRVMAGGAPVSDHVVRGLCRCRTATNLLHLLLCLHLASPSELLASPSELLASPSELLASPSELLASPSELLASPSSLVASPSSLALTAACVAGAAVRNRPRAARAVRAAGPRSRGAARRCVREYPVFQPYSISPP
jgi:hypothetical protein